MRNPGRRSSLRDKLIYSTDGSGGE